MCKCVNIDFGSYENSTAVKLPWDDRIVDIDKCILGEVELLWSHGIRTIESCCGHNKTFGYIAVEQQFILPMIKLGYEPYGGRKNVFYTIT